VIVFDVRTMSATSSASAVRIQPNQQRHNKARHDNPYQPPCFDDFP